MAKTFLLATLISIVVCAPTQARQVAGIDLPETVRVGPREVPLRLNGAGVRKKLWVDVYVGALYLPEERQDVSSILSMQGAKRIVLHFLYDAVSTEKLIEVWTDGIRENHTPEEAAALEPRLNKTYRMFRTMHKGDVVQLDYLPGEGTRVSINGERVGTVSGADFYRAVLRVWLGRTPTDRRLKEAMLGVRS